MTDQGFILVEPWAGNGGGPVWPAHLSAITGHPAEDAAMSLAKLWELGQDDPQAMRDFEEIAESIFAAVSDAGERQPADEPDSAELHNYGVIDRLRAADAQGGES